MNKNHKEPSLALRIILSIGFILILISCAKDPEQSTQVNGQFSVDKLFTKDNCTVYRFMDAGRYVYYTDCHGSTEWSTSENCGKNCTTTYDHSVQGDGYESKVPPVNP